MNQKFIDDEYQHIESELEQIQKCPGMYISSKGTEGAFHLLKEIAGNSFDEGSNINSPCDKVDIYLDEEFQHMIVEDNGRGIPFESMVPAATEKHTGTKFARENNRYSAGCFGVGLKVANAFSHILTIDSYRNNEHKLVRFVDCNLDEHEPEKIKGDKHGLVVNCYPSRELLGDIHVTSDMCVEWLRRMSYIMPQNLTVRFFSMEGDCEKIKYSREYKYEGLEANVKYLGTKLEFDPIYITWKESDSWTEPHTAQEEEGCLVLSMAFSYDKTIEDEANDSYCNGVWTYEGGVHLNMCRSILCDYIVRAARQSDPDSKYPVTPNDVRKGLVMVVNCDWERAILSGQHKSSVASKEIEELGRKGFSKVVANYFSDRGDRLNKIINYCRQMAKIRLASLQMKGVKPPKAMSIYDEADIKGYFKLTDSNRKGYRELIITEGDSASGAVVACINPKFQAIYNTRGPMKNALDIPVNKLLQSDIPRNLSRILEIEPGKPIDVNNVKWSKIIFMQDADADGHNIRSLAALFFLVWCPELVEEGRLYAGVPPLYQFNEATVKKFGLKKNYLNNKREFLMLRNNIIASNIKMWISDGYKEFSQSKAEIIDFLDANKYYYQYLKVLAGREAVDTHIIEHVCNAIVRYGIDTELMIKYLKNAFPEMTYNQDAKSLSGAYDGKTYGIIIDDAFVTLAKDFIDVLKRNPSLFVTYQNKNKGSDDIPEKVTIGDFFKNINHDYDISAEQRFKGLGEAESILLFETAINPKTRRLVRFTMEDRDKAMSIMRVLHGKNVADARKELLRMTEFDDDDIDN